MPVPVGGYAVHFTAHDKGGYAPPGSFTAAASISSRNAPSGRATRFYTVMLARYTGAAQEPDELFCLCGRITDPDMLRHIAGKLLKNAAGMETSGANAEQAQHLHALAEPDMRQSAGIHTLTEEHNGGNSRSGAGVP